MLGETGSHFIDLDEEETEEEEEECTSDVVVFVAPVGVFDDDIIDDADADADATDTTDATILSDR